MLAARDAAEFQARWQTVSDYFPALTTAPNQIGKLRQTMLQLAVQGRITRQDLRDEPASILINRFAANIARLSSENGLTQPLKSIAQPFQPPTGWEVVRLGDLVKFIGGSQPPKSKFIYQPREGYTRLIQIRDFKSDAFKTYVPDEYANRSFGKDDVMIGRYGPPVFQILRGLEGTYNVALMKADPIDKVLSKDYLFYLLQEPKLQHLVISESERTAGQSGVRKDLLHNYFIGLPPLDEQKRIVAAVNCLMALCDELEANLRRAEEDGERLLRAAVRSLLASVAENTAAEAAALVVQ